MFLAVPEAPPGCCMQVLDVLETMGIGKNTTAKSVEAGGGSTEGKYEDESKHPTFFTLPVSDPALQGVMLHMRCISKTKTLISMGSQ